MDVSGLRLMYNLAILISASRRLPELWGYRYGLIVFTVLQTKVKQRLAKTTEKALVS